MTAQLVLKELRQHWLAMLLLAGLLGMGAVLIGSFLSLTGTLGGPFDILRAFLLTFVPIAALVLGNRLVATEYRAKTQLFLEALPLSRWRLVCVKYFLGLAVLLGVVLLIVAMLSVWGARQENLEARFLTMVVLRATGLAAFVYSFFFMTGFLGRYNVAIYLLLMIGFFFIDTETNLEPKRFGPFALVDERFAYERHDWPLVPLAVTLSLSALFFTVSLAMAQLREGTVAAMLGEKMSQREKLFIACLLFGLFFAMYVYDERSTKKPYDLLDALEVEVDGIRVKISGGSSNEDDPAKRLAERVASELAELQRYLEIETLPPIFIVKRSDLDGDCFERAELEKAEGLLARCNYSDPAWDDQRFVAWLVRELLVVASHGRVLHESNRCLLDGFGRFWAHRREESSQADKGRLELRAAFAVASGFAESDVRNWLRYRERVGTPIAESVAWSGLVSLEQIRGADATREFLRDALRTDLPSDVRAMIYTWRNSLPVLLQRNARISYADFMRGWLAQLARFRDKRRAELDALPEIRGSVTYPAGSKNSRLVRYHFECQPAPARGRFVLVHCNLPPFDQEIPESDLESDEYNYEKQRDGELPLVLQAGSRFYWTFAIEVPALDCDMITGWVRDEVP